MNRLQIFRLLRKSAKLSEKRSPALEQNNVAKVMLYIGALLMGAYLIFLGSIFGRLAAEQDTPALILVLLPFVLIIDFLFRFMAQQTPLVFIKPFLLMPMPAKSVVESYLLTMVTSGYNLLWLCLLLPYAYINIVAGVSVWIMLLVVLCGLLMVMINSQWYLIVRTLIVRSLLWWLLPLGIYAAWIVPLFLCSDGIDVLQNLADAFSTAPMLWLLLLILLVVLGGMLLINRNMQYGFVYTEISREQKKPSSIKHVSQFTFLERFGQTGEYLK